MTLSFSHDGPNIGYIGFGVFRRMLAVHEGINLDEMEGYRNKFDTSGIPKKPWKGVKARLRPLYDHSDCEGTLTPRTCEKLIIPLRLFTYEVFGPEATKSRIDVGNPHVINWGTQVRDRDRFYYEFGMDLALAMEKAALAGERLRFE